MMRLSSPIANIKDHYEVVVIGSGYGGGVAASRLSRAGRSVCLLERGREIIPGEYPDSTLAAAGELQVDSAMGHIGARTALYDLRLNDDINVFVGCGLGGTSLVNANVSLRPDDRVFADGRWPKVVREDVGGLLDQAFGWATEMLKPLPYPADAPALAKLQAMEEIAASLAIEEGGKAAFSRPPINVTFEAKVNHVGVEQKACTGCGDCVSGCNYSAKNTVLMNYLPDARNHGAEIYTQTAVRRLERRGARWLVHYQLLNMGREQFDAPTMTVGADLVVLAAGTLGSSEILLRSKNHGLTLSDRVGFGFTGNGDVVAFAYNCDRPINGVGWGARVSSEEEPVGPCIAGLIDLRENEDLNAGMVIEEGALPGGLASLLPSAFAAGTKLIGEDMDAGFHDYVAERAREVQSLVGGAYTGAMANTLTYLVMAHDDGNGRLILEDDRLRVVWPDVGSQQVFKEIETRLREATRVLGGTYVKNPMWTDVLGQRLITVHPLGGCAMAERAEDGVVDGFGRAFADRAGTKVHESLYVFDGSIMPRSIGVNPLLTITAMTERGMEHLAKGRGWHINRDLPSRPPAATARSLGIQFTETMRGYFSTAVKDDYEKAYEVGREADSAFSFTVSVVSDDLDAMLESERHAARMVGSVSAPALSPHPLTVTQGNFNLFVRTPEDPAARRMRYRMRLTAAEGKVYFFEGFKQIRDEFGLDLWSDTTTLFITVFDGDDDAAPVLGRGILKIRPDEFVKQMLTFEVRNASTAAERLAGIARFGRFFAGALYDVYGVTG